MSKKNSLELSDFVPSGFVWLQSILFVLHFGLEISLPVWVLWFPSIVISVIICFFVLILGLLYGMGVFD